MKKNGSSELQGLALSCKENTVKIQTSLNEWDDLKWKLNIFYLYIQWMIRSFSRLFLECCPFSLIYYFVCYWMVKPLEFRTSVFLIGGTVTFTLGSWCSLLGRIPDKNDRCAFTRGSRGEVMIFFEKNKRAGVKKVFIHVYTLIVYLRG